MSKRKQEEPTFSGFVVPTQNWFRMPNNWTDITAGMTTLAELKVVEYVLRHTWGFQEYGISKRISIDEFMHGRRRQDGDRLDQGTGLSKPSVVEGLRTAVEHGYLIEERDDRDRGRIHKSFRLRMKDLAPDVKNLNRGVKEFYIKGKESLHRSEKDTIERNLTVNGSYTTQSPVRQLPDLDQPPEQTTVIAEEIVSQLGDQHSLRFYQLVAAKVPYHVIHRALGEIKVDGAESPAKVFTDRMRRYALKRLTPGPE
jgi:hypothetical protein